MRVASLPSYLEKSSKIVGINGIIFNFFRQLLKIRWFVVFAEPVSNLLVINEPESANVIKEQRLRVGILKLQR